MPRLRCNRGVGAMCDRLYFGLENAILILVMRMKRKIILIIAAILVIPLLLAVFLGGAWIYTQFRDRNIQEEVSEYVLANKDTWEQGELKHKEEIVYKYIGLIDTGIEYGYYYSEDDTHCIYTGEETAYRDGYRYEGYPGDPTGWYYSFRICKNWYYYELHGDY